MDSAAVQANDIQMAAIEYMDTSLHEYQNILRGTINEVKSHEDSLVKRLNEMLQTVGENRAQLKSSIADSGLGDAEAPLLNDSLTAI